MEAQITRNEHSASGGKMKSEAIGKPRHHNNPVRPNLALFAKRLIITQKIIFSNAKDANFLITLKRIVDLVYFGTNKSMVDEFKNKMMKDFEMSDLGLMRYFLGIQVKQSSSRIFLSQEKYIDDVLKKFNMSQCKLVSTPMALNEKLQVNDNAEKIDVTFYRKLIGSLIYLNTRPDFTYSVSILIKFMNKPSKNYFASAKESCDILKEQRIKTLSLKRKTIANLLATQTLTG
ncbi:putative mitochondrial protein [Abeliophyllum distichum]|uniref:Mitochondrial protein n=1 Tax=Abeliophyllum distichum TaxID=126358 RepID=A0ABD1Q2Y3_9LAMI